MKIGLQSFKLITTS